MIIEDATIAHATIAVAPLKATSWVAGRRRMNRVSVSDRRNTRRSGKYRSKSEFSRIASRVLTRDYPPRRTLCPTFPRFVWTLWHGLIQTDHHGQGFWPQGMSDRADSRWFGKKPPIPKGLQAPLPPSAAPVLPGAVRLLYTSRSRITPDHCGPMGARNLTVADEHALVWGQAPLL